MPKARELTEVEKFYIQNNLEKSDSEIASLMKGVGVKTVSKYKEEAKDLEGSNKSETDEQRIERLSDSPGAGNFFARQSGATVMTKQVSEITDARSIVKGKELGGQSHEETNRGKIHRPKG